MQKEIIDASTIFGFWPKRRADISLETLLRIMDEHEIGRACTLSARGIFLDFIDGNQETIRAARANPRLVPVGTVNPARWIGCMDESRRLIDSGIKMIRFFPEFQEWHIGQAQFRKLLREVLAPSGVALMMPASLGVTAIGEMASKIANPVIIDSLRYTFWAEAVVVMQETPNVYVETHLGGWIRWIIDEVGPDRLVFGSNSPISYAASALAPIEYAGITEAEQEMILGANMKRILGL